MEHKSTAARILEAAREVGKREGIEPSITAVIKNADVSNRTFYRYFRSQRALTIALAKMQAQRVQRDAMRVSQIDDSDDALREWMQVGFSMVDEYGVSAVQIARHRIPQYVLNEINVERLYRFTGLLLKRWRNQGYASDTMNVRRAVRVWFSLVSLDRIQGDLSDGFTILDVYQDTCRVFWAAFGR